MNRRNFIGVSSLSAGGIVLDPFNAISQDTQPVSFKIDLVKEFVIAGHGNLDKVKQMMAENPNLVYCSYDWGNGDFEQALEGAGHVGNKEIARYLIDNGARPNIYVLTMLGETQLVISMLTRYPLLLNGKGPHGLTLLHHATKGGDDAKELLEFFKEKGLTEMQVKIK
jgi:ankyrin repeat protein